MTEDEIVAIAKQHRDRYLICGPDWYNKGSTVYQACARLVASGHARWLRIKSPASEGLGEPGPGIQLLGADGRDTEDSISAAIERIDRAASLNKG